MRIVQKKKPEVLWVALIPLALLASACFLGGDDDPFFGDDDTIIEDPTFEEPPTGPSMTDTRPEGLVKYDGAREQPVTRSVGGEDLAVYEQGSKVVASDATTDALYFVNLDGARFSHKATFDKGANPGRIALANEGVYVVLRDAGELALVGYDGELKGKVDACAAPRGVAYDTTREKVWVSCASSEVVSFTPETLEKIDTFFVDSDLRDIAANEKGLYVARFRAAEVLSLNPEQGTILDRRHAPSISGPSDTPSKDVNSLWRMTLDTQGRLLLGYQQTTSGRLTIIIEPNRDETSSPSGFGGYYGGGGSCGGTLSSVAAVVTLDPDGGMGDADASCQAVGALPVDVDEDPCGGPMLLSASPKFSANSRFRTPTNCVPNPEVTPIHTKLATAVYGRPASKFGVVTMVRSDKLYLAYAHDNQGTTYIDLDTNSAPHIGHTLFHGDTGFGLACASCHPEGGDDGHAWLFTTIDLAGGNPQVDFTRRTQNLRGGVKGKLHWSGEFDDIDELMTDVFQSRMGGFGILDSDIDAIDDWLTQLDPEPGLTLPPEEQALVLDGAELYVQTGCADCHSGAMLTDYGMHDVGTNGLRKTPTLRGVGQRRRLMSNGCGERLEDRFYASCGGDAHGNLSDLSLEQRDALMAYLKTL